MGLSAAEEPNIMLTAKRNLLILLSALALTLTVGCGGGSTPEEIGSGVRERTGPVSTNKDDYPVFPDADAGADATVPADQGGKGFTGEGWETNVDFELIGDPHALKGGIFRDHLQDYPGTLRLEGPESNSFFNYNVTTMAYESLLGLHPTTLEYIPSLATHWQISDDKMTFRFRLNPNARFSDGQPVTAEDVVATFKFQMDPTLQSPSNQLVFGKLEAPVAESKYIVSVKAKELNWRNFLYFSGMRIFPAHVLKDVNGETYLKEYNYKLLPGSGPYTILEADIDRGRSITAKRREDYWAANARANVGTGNFDQLRFVVVRDENLAFEMFKKGELDAFAIGRARQWVEELNFEEIQRGLIQKRKIFNHEPHGFAGFALNTRRAPFDDLRVRKALTLLFNRQQLIEKIMYNEYEPSNSYYAYTAYENPQNPKNEYNPQEGLRLLADAGWSSRDSQGRLVKNGVPLQLELLYTSQTFEPHLTVYQEDLRRVGITLNLRLITPETQFQMVNERRFQMAHMAWGGLLFPNPETSWHSRLAGVDNTNNITGFKSSRVDQLLTEYDRMFEAEDRVRVIREIDGILANSYEYILHWSAPYTRVVYWNKFGAPRGYLTRIGDYAAVWQMWWIDPQKERELQEALRDRNKKLEVGPTEDRYWLEYGEQEQSSQL
jgi:microcin C transport system substrate-binding protein